MAVSPSADQSDAPAPPSDSDRHAVNPDLVETSVSVSDGHSVLFFDGVCGLCNASVHFVLKRDRHKHFRFAPLQGATAQRLLGATPDDPLKSVVLWERGSTYRRSTAVTRILFQLGGVWPVFGLLLWLIPRPVRDLGYEVIARNRYRWFGQYDACRLPSPTERQQFLS